MLKRLRIWWKENHGTEVLCVLVATAGLGAAIGMLISK